jgi:ankyrin repeat protein
VVTPTLRSCRESLIANPNHTLLPQARSGAAAQACVNGDARALERLITVRGGLNKRDREGLSPLHWCALTGFTEGVNVVLSHKGVHLNARSTEGYTALHVAAFLGSAAIGNALLEAGASVNPLTRRGASPVAIAAMQGGPSHAILEHLVARNGSTRQRCEGNSQRSPLELAILAHDDERVIDTLLKGGADFRSPNYADRRHTPLHLAARKMRRSAMAALLRSGADPNAVTEQGFTPAMCLFLDTANTNGFNAPQQQRQQQQQQQQQNEHHKRDLLKMLRDAGADLNVVVPGKNTTVLHLAVCHCREEQSVIDIISSEGFDVGLHVNLQLPASRQTMLHMCARNGWADACSRLLAAGADPTVRNKEGFAPLHLAILSSHADVVRIMLSSGVDPRMLAPDIFPSLSRWRMQRRMRAAMLFMNGPVALENAETLLEEMWAREPRATAVDMAVATVQSIPVVEAFVAAGALPSDAALEIAKRCVPLLPDIVRKTTWNSALHRKLPKSFRAAAKNFMLSLRRRGVRLPPDAVAAILTKAAYPVTPWARMDASFDWLESQRARKPRATDRPNAPTATAAAAAAEADDAHPHAAMMAMPLGPAAAGFGGAILENLPGFLHHVMQAVHQELHGGAGGAPGQLAGGVIMMPPGAGGIAPELIPFGPDGVPLAGAQGLPMVAGGGGGNNNNNNHNNNNNNAGVDVPPPAFMQAFVEEIMGGLLDAAVGVPAEEEDNDQDTSDGEDDPLPLPIPGGGGGGMQQQEQQQQHGIAMHHVFGDQHPQHNNNHGEDGSDDDDDDGMHGVMQLHVHIPMHHLMMQHNIGGDQAQAQNHLQVMPQFQVQQIAPPPPPPPDDHDAAPAVLVPPTHQQPLAHASDHLDMGSALPGMRRSDGDGEGVYDAMDLEGGGAGPSTAHLGGRQQSPAQGTAANDPTTRSGFAGRTDAAGPSGSGRHAPEKDTVVGEKRRYNTRSSSRSSKRPRGS